MKQVRTVKDLGGGIRAARKRQGLTQVELAEAAGIGITYLINLEAGKTTAEIGKALHIVEMLSISLFVEERDSRA